MYGMWWKDESDDDYSEYDFNDYNNYVEDYNPIFLAVHKGDLNRVNTLLNKRNVNKNINERTMMHVAASQGHTQILELLLKNGAYIDAEDMNGKTPLFIALESNHLEAAEILLKNNASVNSVDEFGKSPLHLAIEMKNFHLVENLLKNGAKVNVLDSSEYMKPIQTAAKVNDIKIVEILLKHGAKLNELDEMYEGEEDIDDEIMTALHFAAQVGNLEMVKLLMANGFDTVNAKNEDCATPLHLAVNNHHLDVVKYLIENSTNIVLNNEEDYSPIELCTSNEDIDILKFLLDFGLKINKDSGEDSLMYSSLDSGNLELWKYLLTCNSKIYAEICSKETELHSAVRDGHIEIVQEIINKQSSSFKSDSLSSKLAVYIAVENENEEILKILLQSGYSVESCFNDKLTPLHIAATFKHKRLIEILLKFDANINSNTKNVTTPLDFAAAAGHSNIVKFLLDSGADPIKKKEYVSSSLYYALHREPFNTNEPTVTPRMFQNLLKITEMLLIAGDCKMKDKYYYDSLLECAIKLRVFVEDEQTSTSSNEEKNNKKIEFRPEIVRCLLNYSTEDKINFSLNSIISNNSTVNILDVILEYYYSKSDIKISHLNRDYWSNLRIISEIEDFNKLSYVTLEHNLTKNSNEDEWSDLLKMIIARLELLSIDQQPISKESYFYQRYYKYLNWQNKCQKEIIKMQETKIIDELNVTFCDILKIKSIDKVASYMRNDELLNSLVSSYEKFPIYTQYLKSRVKDGKQRIDLIDLCENSMFHLIEKNYKIKFSSIDIQEILQYLSVFDLRKLSAACSSLFSL